MKCPYCLADNDRVLDPRASQDGLAIRRRRECLACKRRYTTYERIEATVKIIKKDGSRELLDHAKIKRGLEKACWKRPIGDEQLEAIIAAVENELEANFESEVESRHIGELVMRHLRELDEVAYVRFASVYRQFKMCRTSSRNYGRCWPRGGKRTKRAVYHKDTKLDTFVSLCFCGYAFAHCRRLTTNLVSPRSELQASACRGRPTNWPVACSVNSVANRCA